MTAGADTAPRCTVLRCVAVGAVGAKPVENGAAAVHAETMMGRNMGKKLLADGAFQMDQPSAGLAFEVEMVTAIPLPHVLVDVGRLGIAAVLAHRSLGAQLGQMTVQGAPALLDTLPARESVELIRQLLFPTKRCQY